MSAFQDKRLATWKAKLKPGASVVECQVGAEAEHKMMMRMGTVKTVGKVYITLETGDRFRVLTLGHENMPFKLYPPDWSGRDVWRHMGDEAKAIPRIKMPKGIVPSQEFPGFYEKEQAHGG